MPQVELSVIGSFWDHGQDHIINITKANVACINELEEQALDGADPSAINGIVERFQKLQEKARDVGKIWTVVEVKSEQRDYYDSKNSASPSQTGLFLKTLSNGTNKYHISFYGSKEKSRSILDEANVHLTRDPANFHLYFEVNWLPDNWADLRFRPEVTVPGSKEKGRGTSTSDDKETDRDEAAMLIAGLLRWMKVEGHIK